MLLQLLTVKDWVQRDYGRLAMKYPEQNNNCRKQQYKILSDICCDAFLYRHITCLENASQYIL